MRKSEHYSNWLYYFALTSICCIRRCLITTPIHCYHKDARPASDQSFEAAYEIQEWMQGVQSPQSQGMDEFIELSLPEQTMEIIQHRSFFAQPDTNVYHSVANRVHHVYRVFGERRHANMTTSAFDSGT